METKHFRHGIILGKFYPPHNGHLHAIDTASHLCDKVTVIVYSLPSEKISGELRANWIKTEYVDNNKVSVKWVEKILPQEPSTENPLDDKEFWNIWKNQLIEDVWDGVNNPDMIFGSENYVNTLADILGIEAFIVDMERKAAKISGTACRFDAFSSWENLPTSVKPYFVKKIAIIGPESTYKSTMVTRLARVFNTTYVEEYGRKYVVDIHPGKKLDEQDFINIAAGHNFATAKALNNATNKVMFLDTDVLVTQSYAKLYLGEYSEQLQNSYIRNPKTGNRFQAFNIDYYFLIYPDNIFYQDGTREFEKRRLEHYNILKELLDKEGCNYVVVIGENKFQFIVDKVRELMYTTFRDLPTAFDKF